MYWPFPQRFADRWMKLHTPADWKNPSLAAYEAALHDWRITPAGTEGYEKAEVTAGGVDTNGLSSATMESRQQRVCTSSARSWTSPAGSAASTSSGPGPAEQLPVARSDRSKHLFTREHALTLWRLNMSDAKVTPSSPDGKNPATASPTQAESSTPENQKNQLNPSAPNDVNITPGTDYTQPEHPPKAKRA